MDISKNLRDEFELIASKYNTTLGDLIRRAIIGMALIRQCKKEYAHLGFVSDPSKLDVELRGLFPENPHLVSKQEKQP